MKPLCIVYVVGTRPNFVKLAPVVAEMQIRLPAAQHVLVHTGQHYDREMSSIFWEDLGLPDPQYVLDVGSGPHGAQTGRALERVEAVLLSERPDIVVVAGDVNSTLAGALAAAKLEVPVAHIEAGLRSFDRTMPEEINRALVDQISRWCFTHSPEAEVNLRMEGVPAERIFFVGNTMIDTLVRMLPRVDSSRIHRHLGLTRGQYILVTLHRPKLVDGSLFRDVLTELERLSHVMPVVFPMHPRTQKRAKQMAETRSSLHLIDPVGYVDFLALEAYSAGVITDSGGVQEETTYLGVPCFTLRDNTERPVTLRMGTNRLLGLRPEALAEIPALLERPAIGNQTPPGWDGEARCRIVQILVESLANASPPEVADGVAELDGRRALRDKPGSDGGSELPNRAARVASEAAWERGPEG